MHRFVETDPLDELSDSFDPSQRCQYTVETDSIPDGWGGWCCYRPVWNGTERCIWHSPAPGKPVEDIREAQEYERSWPREFSDLSPVRRLDETHLRSFKFDGEYHEITDAEVVGGFTLPMRFSIMSCTMFNSNFEHSHLDSPQFSNVLLSGSSFREAQLNGAILQKCDLDDTNFKYSTLENSRILRQDIRDSNWIGAYLNDSNLHDSDLSGTNLRLAKLREANLTQTILRDCNLEEAELEHTDLRDANLEDAKLNEALVRNPRINEGTDFGETCIYEREADKAAARSNETLGDETFKNAGKRFLNRLLNRSEDADSLRGAVRVYRLYQRLLREASLPEDMRPFRIREKHTRRKLALRESKYLQWLKLTFDRWTMLYGESVGRVVLCSLFVIFLFTGLYAGFGEIASKPSTLFQMLYFSIVTFTTLGYGDIQPATEATQMLAAVESFIGVLLMALLVFVLGRRATW